MMPMSGGAAGANPSQVETSGAAMAFTYVPVPVYNMQSVATAAPAGPNMSNILSPGTMQPQGTFLFIFTEFLYLLFSIFVYFSQELLLHPSLKLIKPLEVLQDPNLQAWKLSNWHINKHFCKMLLLKICKFNNN